MCPGEARYREEAQRGACAPDADESAQLFTKEEGPGVTVTDPKAEAASKTFITGSPTPFCLHSGNFWASYSCFHIMAP